MIRPLLSMLLGAAVLWQVVEAWPAAFRSLDEHLERRAEHMVEPKQWRGPTWFSPGITTTTTTLTLSTPGPTSQPSPTSGGFLSGPTSGTTTQSPSSPPNAGISQSLSTGDRQTSSEALVTDTMPTDIATTPTGPQPTSSITASSSDGDSGIGSNRTLVITLSTVLSAVGLALIAGTVLFCWRRRRGRLPFLPRGVSPIDDDEIERWKTPRDEKARYQGVDTDLEADAAFDKETGGGRPSHAKHSSTSSVKKPPSVIVYSRSHPDMHQAATAARHSTDAESRRSFAQNHPAYGHGHGHSSSHGGGKTSFDSKALPQTPIQARAPNARAGLTDESVPGDEPFIPTPKRTPSRLSKHPPNTMGMGGRRANHARARSSRSSTRSFGAGEYYSYYSSGGGAGNGSGGSEVELSMSMSAARHSHDHLRHSSSLHSAKSYYGVPRSGHSRVYSSSSIPPRLSFGDEVLFGGLSSPARPTRFVGEGEIGRAIG